MTFDSRSGAINRRRFIGGTGALAVASSMSLLSPTHAQDATPLASPVSSPVVFGTAADWATFGYDLGQTRHVPFTEISKDNVNDLGIVWFCDCLADDESIPPANQSYPAMVNEAVYITTTYDHVYAHNECTYGRKEVEVGAG